MDLGVGPVDELAVHPDLLEFLHGDSPLRGPLGRTPNSTREPCYEPPPF
jgi:hypothetical protein